jgi:tRNA (guanosine-2'-O-)-methyltransferase
MAISRFPHTDPIRFETGAFYSSQQIIEVLGSQLTDERRTRMREVIDRRTYSVVPVLENIYDRGNVSAVMRSSEAMGFQSVHVIEPGERFKKANRVTQGADKWLDVVRWKTTAECVRGLKSQGYQILATQLNPRARAIGELDVTGPVALVLGNEKDGISPEMEELADACVIIPMQGFVQSYNISVAGAIALYHILGERLRKFGGSGDLTPEEKQILTAVYYLRSADNPESILARS